MKTQFIKYKASNLFLMLKQHYKLKLLKFSCFLGLIFVSPVFSQTEFVRDNSIRYPLIAGERILNFKFKFDSSFNDNEYYVVYAEAFDAFNGISTFEDALESPKLSLGKCFFSLGVREKYFEEDSVAYYVFPQKEYPLNTAKHYYLKQTSNGRLPEDLNYIP